MTDLAVATSGLAKRYRGDVLAVDGVDLRVARGEIHAVLGLNGAGKSTTIREERARLLARLARVDTSATFSGARRLSRRAATLEAWLPAA